MKDVILINKPKGITSFDVIRKLRRKIGVKKIGHAGTLDPLAEGLMILGIGEGTKKLKDYIGLDKVYEFEVLLGEKRTTGDLEGEVLEEKEVFEINEKKLEKILEDLVGEIELPVPSYSAIKKGGEPLYKKARRGEKVEAPAKFMKIYWIKLKKHRREGSHYVLELEAKVGSGTYIRSISEEIGRRLGFPATTKHIKRTKIGEFVLSQLEMKL